MLSHALARVLGLSFNRIQFTSDVLPGDIVGVSVFDREQNAFRFVPGPVFAQVVLADEVNRATPKTQSALLEAMEEKQVTVDGQTRALPDPFFVIATQNPSTQTGTFPLPESQLDRFLMRIEIGYPEPDAERELLKRGDRREMLEQLPAIVDRKRLMQIQAEVDGDQSRRSADRLRATSRSLQSARAGVRVRTLAARRAGAAAKRSRVGAVAPSQPRGAGRRTGCSAERGRTSVALGGGLLGPRRRRAGAEAAVRRRCGRLIARAAESSD